MRSRKRFYFGLATALIFNLSFLTSLGRSNSVVGNNHQLVGASSSMERQHAANQLSQDGLSTSSETAVGPISIDSVEPMEMRHDQHGALIESTALISSALTSSVARLTASLKSPTAVSSSRPAAIVDVIVGIGGTLSFAPEDITITAGDTVRWTFEQVGHNVVSGSACIANNQFCSPSDVDCATTQSSPAGAIYTHTFNQPGTFAYFCSPHCFNFMVGVVRVNPAVPQAAVHCDFDGDRKTDVSVFRPSNGVWYISQSSNNGFRGDGFGTNGDLPAPADYDGDGKNDLAVFRPSTGTFYILLSSNSMLRVTQFGQSGDVPMPGDYDNDAKADVAVFRSSNGGWYRLNSSNGAFVAQAWGNNTDKPALGDFDGDGKTDLAVFRPADGNWYILQSSNNGFRGVPFGATGDIPVAGDYDGDGKSDIAVFRPANGTWYISQSSNNAFRADAFGANGDRPSPGNYDSDNKADVAVFRPSQGTFYILQSLSGFRAQQWGAVGDIPAPSAFVP